MGILDRFRKAAQPESVDANDKHMTWSQLESLEGTKQEVWFRYADEGKPQVNAGYVHMVSSLGNTDIKVTRWNDEDRPREEFEQFYAKHIGREDIFESRDALIAANEERLQFEQKREDILAAHEQKDGFTKAVEDISGKETGQAL